MACCMGTNHFLERLKPSIPSASGVKVAFITNIASRHREELAAKVSSLGFPCDMHEIWGSAYTTARYIARHAPEARVFAVGTSGMVREMHEAGSLSSQRTRGRPTWWPVWTWG